MKKKKIQKKLGTGLSSLLVKDEDLALIVKKVGRPPKKIKPGEYKKNIRPLAFTPKDSSSLKEVATHHLVPGKFQPRKNFDIKEIENLAESIKQNGVLQPILVRPLNNRGSSYEIIAGERRWRAAQVAKLHQVPVIVKNFNDETSLGVALVENLQRSDLNIIEEAEGYRLLMNQFDYTQEKLSSHLGKSRSHIANLLRLLSLPQSVKTYLVTGQLSYGHVRSIITLNENDSQDIVAQIIDKDLNVREAEKLVRKLKSSNESEKGKKEVFPDPNILSLEKELTLLLGLKVTFTNSIKNKGFLSIHYDNLEQLDPIIDKLRWRPK